MNQQKMRDLVPVWYLLELGVASIADFEYPLLLIRSVNVP